MDISVLCFFKYCACVVEYFTDIFNYSITNAGSAEKSTGGGFLNTLKAPFLSHPN